MQSFEQLPCEYIPTQPKIVISEVLYLYDIAKIYFHAESTRTYFISTSHIYPCNVAFYTPDQDTFDESFHQSLPANLFHHNDY